MRARKRRTESREELCGGEFNLRTYRKSFLAIFLIANRKTMRQPPSTMFLKSNVGLEREYSR